MTAPSQARSRVAASVSAALHLKAATYRNLVITDTLKLAGCNLVMGTFNLTIGAGIAYPGYLSLSSGLIALVACSFTRWYATGTALVSGYTSGFPILSNGMERSVH